MMMTITQHDVSSLDLNLLRVLDHVLREGSATGAARRLHVTQSAVSNSLARLRELFGDPLLQRQGRGLTPTPFARRLMPELTHALRAIEQVVGAHLFFDPATTTRAFTLGCTDAHHVHDVPRVAAAFAQRLPHAVLRVISPDTMASDGGADIDALLMPAQGVPPGQPRVELYAEGFAFVVRRGNRKVGKRLTPELFNTLRHIDTLIVQGRGGIGHKLAGDVFAQHGLRRNIAVSVPTFTAAALAAASSDLVAGLPASLADVLSRRLPLRQVEGPLPSITFPMCLTWHADRDADPGGRLFRGLIVETLGGQSSAAERESGRQRGRRAR